MPSSLIRLSSAFVIIVASMANAIAQTAPARIVVESPDMRAGQPMPKEFTADGRNVSPGLSWRGVPASAKEIVVVMIDSDSTVPGVSSVPMIHWMMYGLSPAVKELAGGMPTMEVIPAPVELQGAMQAHTVFDLYGYRGPQPPPGEVHHYRFAVFALDRVLPQGQGAAASEVWQAMQGHIAGEGELAVTYERTLPATEKGK